MTEIEYKYEPTLNSEHQKEFDVFCTQLILALTSSSNDTRPAMLKQMRAEHLLEPNSVKDTNELKLALAKSLLFDLLQQDFNFVKKEAGYYISFSEEEDLNLENEKNKTRNRQLIRREDQLESKTVRTFVQHMEKRRLHNNSWHNIFSVLRSGPDLANELKKLSLIEPELKLEAAKKAVKPYIQFVAAGEKCEYTGLKLSEIWRYLRFSWVSRQSSVPGRSIQVLIRDAAAPNHPIIGIAAIGSAVAQQNVRDIQLGWDQQTFIEALIKNPTGEKARWLHKTLQRFFDEVYAADLLEENIITEADLKNPTKELISYLAEKSTYFREQHRKNPGTAKVNWNNQSSANFDWESYAKIDLYKSKRINLLKDLLKIRYQFISHSFEKASVKKLEKALQKAEFKAAVSILVRRAKSDRVGIDIMDITVCGGIAPYNHILGGKLVGMLLCSSEVADFYNEKYKSYVSVIASGLKGAPFIKKPRLCYLSTTSLYGAGVDQYTRISIPAKIFGSNNNESIRYKKIGYSLGFGSFHFSEHTRQLGYTLSKRDKEQVNFVFGEGANPKMRKLRKAFRDCGLANTEILKHRVKRKVYGVSLVDNVLDVLLDPAAKPNYISISAEKKNLRGINHKENSQKIAEYWVERWLLNRIDKESIYEKLEKELLTYPISHAGRVPIEREEELNLFTSIENLSASED